MALTKRPLAMTVLFKKYNDDGKLHNETGPAYVTGAGKIRYMQNGVLHRVGAPALIESDGTVAYFLNGCMHRVDGPAGICSDERVAELGSEKYEWYWRGTKYTFGTYVMLAGWSDEQIIEWKMSNGC